MAPLFDFAIDSYGFTLLFDIGVDLTGNTGLQIHFRKPDGTTITKSNPAVTDNGAPTAGVLKYIVEQALLDTAGEWRAAPQVDGSSELYEGRPAVKFTVSERYEV